MRSCLWWWPPAHTRWLVVSLLFVSARAGAEASSSDKAAAEALFDQGVSLLRAKDYKEACSKLETSQRIEPAVGTLLYLGECYERLGRTASAWATFREASSLAQASGQAERTRVAAQRADKLEPELAYLSIAVAADARVAGLVVRRGGEVIKPDLYGVSIPADPGEVSVEVSAPGHAPFSTTTTLAARDRSTLTIPPLQAVPGSGTPDPALVTQPKRAAPEAQLGPLPHELIRPAPAPGGTNTGHIVGAIIGSVGLVGVGIGSYFGVQAYRKNRDAENKFRCSGSVCLDPGGLSLTNDALDKAKVSNIAFAAGGGLLALGVVVYLASPSRSQSGLLLTPSIATNSAGLSVQGGFQ